MYSYLTRFKKQNKNKKLSITEIEPDSIFHPLKDTEYDKTDSDPKIIIEDTGKELKLSNGKQV